MNNIIESVKNRDDLKRLNEAIVKAVRISGEYQNVEDGGSCNFDSVVLKIKIPAKLAAETAVPMDKMLARDYSSFWKGHYMLDVPLDGQGNRRTRMAEAAVKSLKSDGYDACVYYQLD